MAGSTTAPITYSTKASKVDPLDWNAAWALQAAVVITTANYTALTTDKLIVGNKTSAIQITIPDATGSGRRLEIKNINTGEVTVSSGTSTIHGDSSKTLRQWSCMQIADYTSGAYVII